jgi:hypothetical protein
MCNGSTDQRSERTQLMTNEQLEKPGMKQKIAHEVREMAWIFVYLAAVFCAMATYSTLLMREFHLSYFAYGTALLNALILAKIILLGEYLKLGRKHEGKPVIHVAAIKAIQFAILMAVFHVIEEVIKHLVHGHSVRSALHELTAGRLTEILARNLVFFCVLVPFFVGRELRRIMGEEKFSAVLFRTGPSALTPITGRGPDHSPH